MASSTITARGGRPPTIGHQDGGQPPTFGNPGTPLPTLPTAPSGGGHSLPLPAPPPPVHGGTSGSTSGGHPTSLPELSEDFRFHGGSAVPTPAPSSGGTGTSSGSSSRTSSNTSAAAGVNLQPTSLLDEVIDKQRGGGGLTPDQQAFQDTIRQTILEQLGISGEIPSINDPILAAQNQAFLRGQQRNFERFQNQAAERFSTQGLLNSGARNVADEGFLQQQGEAAGQFGANLVGQDLIRRRQELQNLLGLATQIQDADLTRDLQERIVAMDAELQRSLGQGDLDLRQLLGLGSLDLQRELGLGQLGLGHANLDLNAGQFMTNDSFRRAIVEAIIADPSLAPLIGAV